MGKYWFTADLHLGHFNIIKYTGRPFKSLKEMNETLIRNWNARVKPEDTVFNVGDFCFKNTKGGKKGELYIIVSECARQPRKVLYSHSFLPGFYD